MKSIVSARQDGICSRLGAMLNAMYLAKITNKTFCYYWPDSEQQMKEWEKIKVKNNFRSLECENEENIFSKEFIKAFSLGNSFQNPGWPYGLKQTPSSFKTTLDELRNEEKNIFVSHIPCFNYIEGIDKEDYYENMKILWNQIDFCDQIKKVMNQAKNKALGLGGFVTIHLRIADVALNEEYKNTGYFVYKFSPLELVFEIIRKEMPNKIVLLADDFDGAKILRDYCHKQNLKDVFVIDEFMKNENYNENDRVFFEVAFMTFSKKVYTGDSNFSKFASRVGLGQEAIYISEVFSNQQRYELILQNINDSFTLKPLQEAYKYLYLYTRAKLIKKSWSELEGIAYKALKLDATNSLFKICILECLLQQKQFEKAENYFSEIMDCNFLDFIKDLLNPMMIFRDSFFKTLSNVDAKYNKLYKLYLIVFKNSKKLLGSPFRIKNHLAYRLGQVAIENSKTISGYIKLPFILAKVYMQYNKEQQNYQTMIKVNPNLALPKLKEYADYQEALKIKRYFTYRLGEAIIQANNHWYGGGYIKLLLEIARLKKEFRDKGRKK